jgi:hypothetical protein
MIRVASQAPVGVVALLLVWVEALPHEAEFIELPFDPLHPQPHPPVELPEQQLEG